MSTFSLLALALSSVGLAGVVAYTVSRRTREIGIRLALGAQRTQVLRMVLAQGLRLTAMGLGIGLAGAYFLSRFLSTVLFDVSATDAATYVTVAGLLLVVAVVACYVPATRAMRVDPIATLRSE
jgi:ABC-type antimicrobial peptide transport system permease subunit